MTTTILLFCGLAVVAYLLMGLILGVIMAAFSGTSEKSDTKMICIFSVTWGWFLLVNLWRGLKR